MSNALTTNGAGLGDGIDVASMVASELAPMQQPITALEDQQTTLSQESQTLSAINSGLVALHSDVQQFTNIDGAFSAKTASSSDDSQLTATANPLATVASHTIVVTKLASTASYGTNTSLATADTTFGTGTFNIQVGNNAAVPITVTSSNNTLNGLATTIDGMTNLGVTATVYTDAKGAHLSIVSNQSGAASDITIDPTSNTTGLTFQKGATGADAQLTVDGLSIDSASNTISTVIPGVTLNLTDANATPVTLTVAPDTSSMTSAVNTFVSDYNVIISAINNQFAYDPNSGQAPSPLQGDTNLQLLQQQLFNDVSYSMSGNSGVVNLESLGVSMGDDGTLTVDSSTLTNQISTNAAAVSNFFQGTTTSWGQNFNNDLYKITNTTTGILNVDMTGITNTQTSLTSQINDMEANLATQQTQLTNEYDSVDTTLEELPNTLATINSELSGLKG
jgi:flagellar hook-associated protein 2